MHFNATMNQFLAVSEVSQFGVKPSASAVESNQPSSVADNKGAGKSSVRPAMFRSTFVWAALLAALLNAAAGAIPRQALSLTADKDAALTICAAQFKADFSRKHSAQTNTLLLGSSLLMAAAYYSDGAILSAEQNRFIAECEHNGTNPFQAYPYAHALERSLQRYAHKNATIDNQTVAACMASDAALIIEQTLRQHHPPQTIIWGIAPRDFNDNIVPPIGKTPTYQVRMDWNDLPLLLATNTPFTRKLDLVLSSLSPLYKDRTALCAWLSDEAKNFLVRINQTKRHHTPSVAAIVAPRPQTAVATEPLSETELVQYTNMVAAVDSAEEREQLYKLLTRHNGELPEPAWKASFMPQYVGYWQRYHPINLEQFKTEFALLDRAMKDCHQKSVNLILVNMPLPRRHQQLIPATTQLMYDLGVHQLCNKYNVRLINLNQPENYEPQDWIDSVHLSRSGAIKFIGALSVALR